VDLGKACGPGYPWLRYRFGLPDVRLPTSIPFAVQQWLPTTVLREGQEQKTRTDGGTTAGGFVADGPTATKEAGTPSFLKIGLAGQQLPGTKKGPCYRCLLWIFI
jgi:hypothetical protein